MRKLILFILVLSLGSILITADFASAIPVDLELVLAVDVSGSVDAGEFSLQATGYVNAFNSPSLVTAIQNGAIGSIATSLVYWAGSDTSPNTAVQATNWFLIDDLLSSQAFATAINNAPRPSDSEPDAGVGSLTGVMAAINFSTSILTADNGFEGTRNVIDVSGDGRENTDLAGWPDETLMAANVSAARDAALAGIVDAINGLAILNDEADLLTWYSANVIGGTDSFGRSVANFNDFGNAIQEKLIREIDPVPEPSTMLLLSSGLIGLAVFRKKFKRK